MAILRHYEAEGLVESFAFRLSKGLVYKEDAEDPNACKVGIRNPSA